uniref:Uncharacterized protein n=1 Tax=Anguilla anguilla TaxID=7936 RepID=A0A0E9UJZ4_ANGAN
MNSCFVFLNERIIEGLDSAVLSEL